MEPLPGDGEALPASTITAYRDQPGIEWECFLQNMEEFTPKSSKRPFMKVAPGQSGSGRQFGEDQVGRTSKRPSGSSRSSEEDYIDAAKQFRPKSPPPQIEPPHVIYKSHNEYTKGGTMKGKEKGPVRVDGTKKHKRGRKE